MYYTVIKHSGHLRPLEKCRKHSPEARVFYISLVFSNDRRVLSQCNTRLRLLYLLRKVNNNQMKRFSNKWSSSYPLLKLFMCMHRMTSFLTQPCPPPPKKINVENTRLRLVFSTFPSCSQMTVVFYHSVIHGLGFFIC